MGVPLKQIARVGAYVMKQKVLGRKRFPLVLMLEPLFRCNLACAGCGKIQYPEEILKKNLTPEDCFRAAEECGAPVVSVAGGEPLIHPAIDEIANGLVFRKKFVYLCTNGILLEKNLHRFTPSVYLTFNVHLDGARERHDQLVGREGVFDKAVAAIRAAKEKGFRITTNTTIFDGEEPQAIADFFDFVTTLGVDGMTLAPGYSYEKAPDQSHFLRREKITALFRDIFDLGRARKSRWKISHSPFYLDFLEGKVDYECTPWGNPNYSVLGWQKPCYLFSDGYALSFKELLAETSWEKYGRASGNPKCADCMAHCGYEPSAVEDSTRNLANGWRSLRSAIG
jgi:hopanoid biosynthesis associated radical SAM protein HpnH